MGEGAGDNWLVATQIFFIFTPKIGEIIHFDDQHFQTCWFNHQPDLVGG